MSSDSPSIKVSKQLPALLDMVEEQVTHLAGSKQAITIIVWTDLRANYISNARREDVIRALKEMLEAWERNMPDIPAHHVN
ncbi:hypothetical protein MTYP_01011 [Methylophilaceae bacterium]|nr:hypothetical protein MTYP_01011 [Methylophilaceae bacterium]